MDRIIEKKKWPGRKILMYAAGGLLLLLGAKLLLFSGTAGKLYVDSAQLTIDTVKKSRFQEFIPVDGIVMPIRTIFLDAVEGGIVEKVFVEDGAVLKEGDPILKLKNADMELNHIDQETRMYDAINNLQNTQVGLEQNKFTRQKEVEDLNYKIDKANLDFQRKQQLYDQKLISDEEYENARRDYQYLQKNIQITRGLQQLDSIALVTQSRQIRSSVERMNKNLDMLRENLANLLLRAPVDGQLSSFSAEIGETKNPGEHLGQIDILDGFKLRSQVDERYINRVRIGQEAEFDYSGVTYQLKVNKIYTQVSNGTFQVDMVFVNGCPEDIKRGQSFPLKLKFSSPADAVIVKRGGFFEQTGGNWIYVMDPGDKSASRKDIRLGRQNTEYYEVLEGLQPGDKVIVSSYENYGEKEKLILK